MSLAHIKLHKNLQTDVLVTYIVRSPDFSTDGDWSDIGTIDIDLINSTYAFNPIGSWASEKIVPPSVYEQDESTQSHLLATQYAGFGYGAWTGRIASQVRRMLNANQFPDSAP
jgi:hypothetical protein